MAISKPSSLCIALIGGIASGKSTVSQLFETEGIVTLDADQVARDLVAPQGACYQGVLDHFGADFFNPDHTLNRSHLRAYIFEHPKERDWLEKLLHPKIREALELQASTHHNTVCLVAIPLLKRREDYAFCQRVLYIKTTQELQLTRLMQRDRIDETRALQILKAQPSDQDYRRLADDVIENSGNLEALKIQVQRLAARYLASMGHLGNS